MSKQPKQPKPIKSYHHPAPPPPQAVVVVDPALVFYVTVRERLANDGSHDRYACLAGPFNSHAEALALVDGCRGYALVNYREGEFCAYGTASMPRNSPNLPVGLFNPIANMAELLRVYDECFVWLKSNPHTQLQQCWDEASSAMRPYLSTCSPGAADILFRFFRDFIALMGDMSLDDNGTVMRNEIGNLIRVIRDTDPTSFMAQVELAPTVLEQHTTEQMRLVQTVLNEMGIGRS